MMRGLLSRVQRPPQMQPMGRGMPGAFGGNPMFAAQLRQIMAGQRFAPAPRVGLPPAPSAGMAPPAGPGMPSFGPGAFSFGGMGGGLGGVYGSGGFGAIQADNRNMMLGKMGGLPQMQER